MKLISLMSIAFIIILTSFPATIKSQNCNETVVSCSRRTPHNNQWRANCCRPWRVPRERMHKVPRPKKELIRELSKPVLPINLLKKNSGNDIEGVAAIGVVVLYEATLLSGVVTHKRDFYVEAVRRMQTIHFECVGPFPCVEDKQGNAVFTKDILELHNPFHFAVNFAVGLEMLLNPDLSTHDFPLAISDNPKRFVSLSCTCNKSNKSNGAGKWRLIQILSDNTGTRIKVPTGKIYRSEVKNDWFQNYSRLNYRFGVLCLLSTSLSTFSTFFSLGPHDLCNTVVLRVAFDRYTVHRLT
ncbi:hypothetical protein YC2023_012923 [Brassica napus]